jgi:hypothetical protein
MKNTIFVIYFLFVSLTFTLAVFSVIFHEKLYYSWYEKHFPEMIIIPQYDSITGEVVNVNANQVTVWNDSDYVPWYGIAAYEAYRFYKAWGVGFWLLSVLLYFPVLYYNRKNRHIVLWIILAFQLAMYIYVNSLMPYDYGR